MSAYLRYGEFQGLEFKLNLLSENLYSASNHWDPMLKASRG